MIDIKISIAPKGSTATIGEIIVSAIRRVEAIYAEAVAAKNEEIRGKALLAMARLRELRAAL